MLDPLNAILAAIICVPILALLLGFVIGRISAPTFPKKLGPFDISDEALAHIVHEASRGYERSLGVIRLKTWNNLTPAVRAALTRRIGTYRRAGRPLAPSFQSYMTAAIVNLTGGR